MHFHSEFYKNSSLNFVSLTVVIHIKIIQKVWFLGRKWYYDIFLKYYFYVQYAFDAFNKITIVTISVY